MASIKDLEKIVDVEGVSQYLLLGPGGQIISHNMDNHIIFSSMVITCASICKLITAERFHSLIFRQEDGRDFYIFPVGKHYLAILKKAESSAKDLPIQVANFIKNLAQL